jgi:hypothetical protein
VFYPRTLLTRRIPRCSEPPSQCGAVYTPTLTKEAPLHRNAPLTPEGRRRLCRLIEDGLDGGLGRRVDANFAPDGAQVVAPLPGWRRPGAGGLLEPAASMPHQDPGQGRASGVELRRRHQVSAARLAERAGLPASRGTPSGPAMGSRGSLTSSAAVDASCATSKPPGRASSSTST